MYCSKQDLLRTWNYLLYSNAVNASAGISPNNFDEKTISIDVDGDANADLWFTSIEDSIYNSPQPTCFKRLEVDIVNDQFELAAYPNSGLRYDKEWIGYDYFGTFPRKTYFREYSCTQGEGYVDSYVDGYTSWWSYNTVRYFNQGDPINPNLMLWKSDCGRYNMNTTAYEFFSYGFSGGFDSLIGNHDIYPTFCHLPPENSSTYLIFRKSTGSEISYGWIEIFIQDTDHLTVNTVGIFQEF